LLVPPNRSRGKSLWVKRQTYAVQKSNVRYGPIADMAAFSLIVLRYSFMQNHFDMTFQRG